MCLRDLSKRSEFFINIFVHTNHNPNSSYLQGPLTYLILFLNKILQENL